MIKRSRLRLLSLIVVALAAVAVGSGCRSAATGSGDRPVVVATTTQLGDLARQVGGSRIDVHQILDANSDPHEYEPRPSDAQAVADAKLVLRSGGELDKWLGGVLNDAGVDAPVVTLIDSVHAERRDGDVDPHWWQDPRNVEAAVAQIRASLTKSDPAGRATYAANAKRYAARVRALDGQIAACMRRVPARERLLVTTHDALGYYAQRYDIRIVGALIPALSTQAQPSSKQIAALVEQIRKLGVRAVFPETSINAKLEQAVSRETGAKIGRALWADSLGPKGSDGATYLQSLRANTEAMVDGFSGGRVRCSLGS